MLNNYKIDNDVLIVYNHKDNFEIMCDATDYNIVSQHNTWYLADGYAVTHIKGADGKRTLLQLHRLLINPPADMFIDHINGIKHDNRRSNLRIATTQENNHNRQSAKGYYWDKNRGKYRAQIMLNYKMIYLGLYNTADEARQAYLAAKKIYHPSAPVYAA